MASPKDIRRRIKSVKNTKKITKAMELVAASKMRKAVSSTLSSRPYANYARSIAAEIIRRTPAILTSHPLLKEHESNKKLIVLVTSNRGLCGAYNAQVLRTMLEIVRTDDKETVYEFLTIGRKGEAVVRRLDHEIVASFTTLPESIQFSHALPIANLLLSLFEKGEYKEIIGIYTDFISALSQKPHVTTLLPFSKPDTVLESEQVAAEENSEFVFEPTMGHIFDTLLHKIFRTQIFQILLESVASEQSSRMVAMKNASEAAGEMITDLTLIYNKARQASITKEISEISAGMASLS